jgi:hypothetical protein
LNTLARLLALLGLSLFSYMNGTALLAAYDLLAALHQQFRIDYGQSGRFHEGLQKAFVMADFTGRQSMIALTHGAAFTVVALALVVPSFVQHRRRLSS